jgi:disulfide bond formation protein DsbB
MHTLITLMALGTVAVDIAIVALVIALFIPKYRASVLSAMRTYGLLSILILSSASVAGTLLMQYAGALVPCLLCWWQRVFMYPIAFIGIIALVKNTRLSLIADYTFALSVFGAAVALYQHLLQILPAGSLIPCDAAGDCAVRSVFEFGFVTIPWMAFSVFVLLALIALVSRKE